MNRDIFTCGHRHGPRNQPCHSCHQYTLVRSMRGGHSEHQASGRQYSVIRTENCSTQPANAIGAVPFDLTFWHSLVPQPSLAFSVANGALMPGPSSSIASTTSSQVAGRSSRTLSAPRDLSFPAGAVRSILMARRSDSLVAVGALPIFLVVSSWVKAILHSPRSH